MDRPMISSPILRDPTDVSKSRIRFIIFPSCISKILQLNQSDRPGKDTSCRRNRFPIDVTKRQQGSSHCAVKTKRTGEHKSNFTSRAVNRRFSHKVVIPHTPCAETPCQSWRSSAPLLCLRDSITARALLVRTVMSLVASSPRQAQTTAVSHEPPSKDMHAVILMSSASW